MEFYEKNEKEIKENNKNEIEVEKNEEIEVIEEKTNKKNNKKILIIFLLCITIFLMVMFCCSIFALLNINNEKIVKGVTINKINLENLTKEEAVQILEEKIEQKIKTDIKIKYNEFEYSIKLSQIELEYKIEEAVEKAYSIGRSKNIFLDNYNILRTRLKGENLDLEYSYNEELLVGIINDVAVKIPEAVIEPNYYIENNKLYISKGKSGNTIQKEKLRNSILQMIEKEESEEISLEVYEINPTKIDIDKIYKEVYKEPKDAYYTKDPFQIFPHEDGVKFDIEVAKKVLEEEKEEYEIALIIEKPNITTDKLGTEAFPDMLSSFSTKYDASNVPRTTNLKLAMQKLDGVVVNPGETFSYNKTLGKRTAEAGYKEAGGYAGGRVVQTLAGGICQISSTLYDAAVYANLDILERHNHMFLAGYVEAGKDATVVYGSYDFKFKNTRKYPIMIKTSIGSGIAKISIFGIKEETEYEVEISTKVLSYNSFKVIYEDDPNLEEGQEKVVQNGMNGCKSITYKILKLNGQQISSTVLSTDTYDAMNKIIKRGTKKTVETSSEIEQLEPISSPIVEETTISEESVVEQEITQEENNQRETTEIDKQMVDNM